MGRFDVLSTAIGPVGLVWDDARVIEVWLPAGSADAMRRRLGARHETSAVGPDFVVEAARGICRLLAGQVAELSGVPVDLDALGDFDRAVLALTRAIPLGSTRTYGEIADELGEPAAAQAVGRALGRNPVPIVVPCHRVIGRSSVGGFSAPGGSETKVRILEIESAHSSGPVQDPLPF